MKFTAGEARKDQGSLITNPHWSVPVFADGGEGDFLYAVIYGLTKKETERRAKALLEVMNDNPEGFE